jgi:heme-degrading monooxygenase HmoA
MVARVSRYELPGDRADDAVTRFGEAFEQITQLDGFRDGYLLVDRESDCATTITIWSSVAAMEASRVTATRLRTEAAQAADGVVTSSQEFEVAIHTQEGRG